MPVVTCFKCKKIFNRKPSQIALSKKQYCSLACARQAQRNGKKVACFVCGLETYKSKKELRVSKSKKYFCGKSCQTKWRNSYFIGPKHGNYKSGRYSYRSVLERNKIQRVCNFCRTEDRRILAVHHVDLNHFNNKLNNLRWLCHNCHFLVHHDKLEMIKFLKIIDA